MSVHSGELYASTAKQNLTYEIFTLLGKQASVSEANTYTNHNLIASNLLQLNAFMVIAATVLCDLSACQGWK